MLSNSKGARGNGAPRVMPTSTEENNNESVFPTNISAPRAPNPGGTAQTSALPRQPVGRVWKAPANFLDDIETDDSRSTTSYASSVTSEQRKQRQKQAAPVGRIWKPPAHFMDVGNDTLSIASSIGSFTWSDFRGSAHSSDTQRPTIRQSFIAVGPESESSDDEPFGGRGNLARENRPRRRQYPCFGNALVEPESADDDVFPEVAAPDPLPPRTDWPNTAASEPNTTVYSEDMPLNPGHHEHNARNVYLEFMEPPEKPKRGEEPVLDLKKVVEALPLAQNREGRPNRTPLGSSSFSMRTAVGWEQMDCRERAYPWIKDVFEMYETPAENKDIFKECETAGKFLAVEQFNDGTYDYVKCWILNNEFPMKMMIVPFWCFPKQKPKVGSYYNGNFHLVWHKIGPYSRRKILRMKAGAVLTEQTGPQSRYLGKLVRLVHSDGCWAKILKMHVRILFTHNGEDMETYYFRKLLFDGSQSLPFPEGAITIEGTGWIEPMPGISGTNPEPRGADVKLFYLIGKFAETVIQWDDPAPPRTRPPKKKPSGLIGMDMRDVMDATRYEWQPRHVSSVVHYSKKKPVDEKPRIVPSKNKYTKTQRILLSIEILRRIRARNSVFGQLNPDKVFRLECGVGDREIASKSRRIRELTLKLCAMINHRSAYNWIMEREPVTIKDMFEIIKMNINYVPGRRDAVAEWLRPVMFPDAEDSDYEQWED